MLFVVGLMTCGIVYLVRKTNQSEGKGMGELAGCAFLGWIAMGIAAVIAFVAISAIIFVFVSLLPIMGPLFGMAVVVALICKYKMKKTPKEVVVKEAPTKSTKDIMEDIMAGATTIKNTIIKPKEVPLVIVRDFDNQLGQHVVIETVASQGIVTLRGCVFNYRFKVKGELGWSSYVRDPNSDELVYEANYSCEQDEAVIIQALDELCADIDAANTGITFAQETLDCLHTMAPELALYGKT